MAWNIEIPDPEYYDVGDPRIESLIREIEDHDVVAIDTETTGLKVWKDYPLFWSLAWGQHRRICMPAATLPYFDGIFKDETRRWALANAKFDMHMLGNLGVTLAGDTCDVAVMHALLYEEESHALKEMARQVLGWRWSDFFDTFKPLMLPDTSREPKVLKSGKISAYTRRESIQEMLMRAHANDLNLLTDYASNDAYGTLRIYEKLKAELESTDTYSLYPEQFNRMSHVFFRTEMPFTKVLFSCERNGVYASRDRFQSLRQPMWDEHEQLLRNMVRLSGDPQFNPNSTEQLRDWFINHEGLQPLMMTKGGKSGVKQPSMDKGFLEHYEHESEMATLILRDRKLTKLIGTYIDGVDEHLDARGRIHTKFNQDVARTGRLSSSEPNLQNIPTPEKDKFKLRSAFMAEPGCDTELIVGDYEQLEMRLLACATATHANPGGARDMIQVFLDGKDIHMGNAEMVFGPLFEQRYGWRLTYDFLKEAKKIDGQVKSGELPLEARTDRVEKALFARNAIKAIGFGLNYGMKEGKLGRSLGVSKEEAVHLIEAYLGTYPAVSDFYADAIAETQETGFSFTLLGRRRFHPFINSSNKMDRWGDERKCVNNQIQGTAADAVRLAMIRLHGANLEYKYGCKMLLQVHDELMFECPKETSKQAREEIRSLMEHPFPTDLLVPLTTSLGIGPTWDTAK